MHFISEYSETDLFLRLTSPKCPINIISRDHQTQMRKVYYLERISIDLRGFKLLSDPCKPLPCYPTAYCRTYFNIFLFPLFLGSSFQSRFSIFVLKLVFYSLHMCSALKSLFLIKKRNASAKESAQFLLNFQKD